MQSYRVRLVTVVILDISSDSSHEAAQDAMNGLGKIISTKTTAHADHGVYPFGAKIEKQHESKPVLESILEHEQASVS